MSGSLEGLSVPERGASGDYTPADLEKLSSAVEGLVAGYISLAGKGGGNDSGEVLDFIFDIFAEGLALRIPQGVNGQGLLDLAVEAMETRLPVGSGTEDTNLLYLSQVVEALYKAGHNNLLLRLDAPMWSNDEIQHLHGTATKPLVLSVSGHVRQVEHARHCHLTLAGGTDGIEGCTDTRFDLFRGEGDWPYVSIDDGTRGCALYFHGFSEDEAREIISGERQTQMFMAYKVLADPKVTEDTEEAEPRNTYFVEDGAGSWKEVLR